MVRSKRFQKGLKKVLSDLMKVSTEGLENSQRVVLKDILNVFEDE